MSNKNRKKQKPAPVEQEQKTPWYKTLSFRIGAALLAVAVTVAGAFGTRLVDRIMGPEPGSGFEPAVAVIPRCGQVYAMDRVIDPDTGAAELLSLDGAGTAGFDDFLREQRAAPVESITVEITFTGQDQHPTRILDVRVEALQTAPNAAGTELATYCGGDPPTRTVTLDMDTPPRSLMSEGKPYFDGHDLDVSAQERETLRVSVSAARGNYRWYFAIDHIDGSNARTTSYIGRAGKLYTDAAEVPADDYFGVTGAAKAYGARYTETSGRFRLNEQQG
ncbi:hypothetical protein ACTI_73930 [Actinoplanes sp. OR16]|uniref:hypothetical protein n=1 Tax=Actinoplanes sp. OR16 TaxID=946334 RepID=UPI000F6BFFC2|nr:hypothetical protein [Actinoplanes sp. OR16]BBH70708.1 hypothetical protein ACTI_73930 [Actinoplanes sp. OR16]